MYTIILTSIIGLIAIVGGIIVTYIDNHNQHNVVAD